MAEITTVLGSQWLRLLLYPKFDRTAWTVLGLYSDILDSPRTVLRVLESEQSPLGLGGGV
jgi:hypothetical protein